MARAVDPPASARAVVSPMISTTTCRSRSGPELLQNLTLQQKHRVFGAEVGGGRTGRTAAAEEPCPLDRHVAFLEQRPERSEERRVGKGWVGTCSSQWAPYP